ncbi:MAG: UDP-N-acetylglucosamine 2-epimerase [Nanoarchaeota archaeon]|nr:UDP-N-acetylglucosamine 2-epimerase [Nanoarchaeota archaeon]
MPKKLIIITEREHIPKFIKEIDNNTTVISCNDNVCQELKKRKIKNKSVDEIYKYNSELGIKWIKNLAKKNIKNQNLMSFFEFRGTSLWWWMEYWLYESYAYYDSLKEITRVFHTIYNILKKEKPDEIIYIKEGRLHDKTIKIIANKFGIKTKEISSNFKLIQFKIAKKIKMTLIKNLFDLRFISRKTIWNLLNKKNKRLFNTKKIPILIINWSSDRDEKHIKPIIEKLDKNKYDVYALDVASNNFLDFSILKEKSKNNILKHILLENYIKKKETKTVKKIQSLWNFLRKDNNFKGIFKISDINIWPLVEPQLSCYFNVRLKDHLISLIAVDNVISSIKPKIAVTPTETSEFDKGLFVSCQRNKIPVISIQHGLFNDLRCIHDKGEVSLKEIKPEYCPIPTITTVYGNCDKDFLIKKGNYPENSVIVTGNHRYDVYINLHKRIDKNQVYKELKIDSSKKNILIATQPFPHTPDREKLIKIVSEAVKTIKDIQLIIKVHPEESVRLYEKIVKNNDVKAIITKYDINKSLYICEILVTVSSTVGLEAAILEKPVIIISSIKTYDTTDFVKKGIALKAYDSKELKKLISKISFNSKTKFKLHEKRKKYIYDHCYKMDGKSSERIVNLIENNREY